MRTIQGFERPFEKKLALQQVSITVISVHFIQLVSSLHHQEVLSTLYREMDLLTLLRHLILRVIFESCYGLDQHFIIDVCREYLLPTLANHSLEQSISHVIGLNVAIVKFGP